MITQHDQAIYGKIHSYSPRTLLTLIETPPNSKSASSRVSQSPSPSDDEKYDKNAKFTAINIQHIKSIHALEKNKYTEKIHINDTFANKINAPCYIPKESLGYKIRNGTRDTRKQELEFRLRLMAKDKLSGEGLKLFRNLVNVIPIDTFSIDPSGDIKFEDSAICILKPYKPGDVKVINGDDTQREKEQYNYIKKQVSSAWEKIEKVEKGG